MTSPKTITNAVITYQVKVKSAAEHLFEVSMQVTLPKDKSSEITSVTVALPAWIPGSYMIRDFSRNLHKLTSPDNDIVITQADKQHWQIAKLDSTVLIEFRLQYEIYAFDLSVRSAFINDEYAFFNGTSVFLCVKDYEYLPHRVTICEEQDTLNAHVVTALAKSEHSPLEFSAPDYFELIDHPVLIGKYDDYCFDAMGHRFHLVFTGQHLFDFPRMERDLTLIIEHHIRLFGEFPCKEYWFITLVSDQGFGGLEHLASTVLHYSRFDLPAFGESNNVKTKEYQQFLALCSHELFHTWHVKRIKPKAMHQPKLFEEVYTPQLWIYEGFTSLYDDLSLARTKLISPSDYTQVLSENITRLIRNPGRLKQSASSSSFEAWNKFYKQDSGSINHIVSYYNKGAIIALCLDITLRQQSNNNVTLDTVMLHMWQQYGQTNIGTNDDVILNLCEREFGIDISSFLYLATMTTIDLPIPSLLEYIGLQVNFRACQHFKDKGGNSVVLTQYDIGAVFSMVENDLKVISVQESRAASRAGLQVGDTIIAFNKWQCDDKRFIQILNQSKLGDLLPIDVIRDGRLMTLSFEILSAIPDTCEISIKDEVVFEKWLGLTKEK